MCRVTTTLTVLALSVLVTASIPSLTFAQKKDFEDVVDIAAERGISREIMEDAKNHVADFKKHGETGFKAVCLLIETGHTSSMLGPLIQATMTSGLEEDLLKLCKRDDLPQYAQWTALSGLGYADTMEVRTYLAERLATERDPGHFMSITQALARLDDSSGDDAMRTQLLRFEDGWRGVEQHILYSVSIIEAASSVETMEQYIASDEARYFKSPLDCIAKSDPERAKELAVKILAKRDDLKSPQKFYVEQYANK